MSGRRRWTRDERELAEQLFTKAGADAIERGPFELVHQSKVDHDVDVAEYALATAPCCTGDDVATCPVHAAVVEVSGAGRSPAVLQGDDAGPECRPVDATTEARRAPEHPSLHALPGAAGDQGTARAQSEVAPGSFTGVDLWRVDVARDLVAQLRQHVDTYADVVGLTEPGRRGAELAAGPVEVFVQRRKDSDGWFGAVYFGRDERSQALHAHDGATPAAVLVTLDHVIRDRFPFVGGAPARTSQSRGGSGVPDRGAVDVHLVRSVEGCTCPTCAAHDEPVLDTRSELPTRLAVLREVVGELEQARNRLRELWSADEQLVSVAAQVEACRRHVEAVLRVFDARIIGATGLLRCERDANKNSERDVPRSPPALTAGGQRPPKATYLQRLSEEFLHELSALPDRVIGAGFRAFVEDLYLASDVDTGAAQEGADHG